MIDARETLLKMRIASKQKKPLRFMLWARVAVCVVAILVSVLCASTRFGYNLDMSLRDFRNALHTRAATGDVALIEIDARSLRTIDHWPWPRSIHGKLIDRLVRAKARTIAFDVDFSTLSNRAEDASFADALQRAHGAVILPTFPQFESNTSSHLVDNVPIKPFSDNAFLGAVNIQADSDGLIRRFPTGVRTVSVPRPSVAALLAEVSDRIDEDFMIDGSIDPATIPRFSAADILSDKVPNGALAGRRLLIGATALEMGDRYPMPHHGVLPGALIQLLAAETLMQHSNLTNYGAWPLLILAIIGLLIAVRFRRESRAAATICAGAIMIQLVVLLCEVLKWGTAETIPASVLLLTSATLLFILSVRRHIYRNFMLDAESGLPNARALEKRLNTSTSGVVCGMRIARYAEIGAILSAGERAQLLTRLGERLSLSSEAGRVYRVMDDGFAWEMMDDDPEIWLGRLEALRLVMRQPIQVGARSLDIVPHFGIATAATSPGPTRWTHALLAANRASELGILWEVHSALHEAEMDWKMEILGGFDEALARGDLFMVYQPKASVATGQILGAEALIRWHHAHHGPIGPDLFIPLLEREGHMADLTLFALRSTITQIQRWAGRCPTIKLSVNISAPLLNDSQITQQIVDVVRKSGINPAQLMLEITESARLDDTAQVLNSMVMINDFGIELSIDDYGTGQSTLSYLKKFPVSEIKIDKSFVTDLANNPNDKILVRSTIDMAHDLGFAVVAEGIEDKGTLALLAGYDCDIAQGWLIGRPLRAQEFETSYLVDSTNIARAA